MTESYLPIHCPNCGSNRVAACDNCGQESILQLHIPPFEIESIDILPGSFAPGLATDATDEEGR